MRFLWAEMLTTFRLQYPCFIQVRYALSSIRIKLVRCLHI